MSDEEMPHAGDMGMDDMSDDDMGPEDMEMPKDLPEGIDKEILTEAPSDNWRKPKKGDEVTVHYVGTLKSDGSEFDSSRSRSTPFVFTLGKGQVIKGWDLGVATMKKGEIAKFTLAPEFAYGDEGSPPKIPEKATLIFEVELISWMSKDDLFGDEGVIKSLVTEGSGWKKPSKGSEVLLSLKAEGPDGSVMEELENVEYTLGSDKLGPLCKVCDKALEGMKMGEECKLKCSKEYSYGDRTPDGATLTLKLNQIYDIKDVSFNKDKVVRKKQIVEGEGYATPKDGNKVQLSVENVTDGASPLQGFTAKTLDFIAGNGEVCDALECAVAEMKKGEKAILTVTKPSLAAEEKLGIKCDSCSQVVLTVQLLDFEKGKDQWDMSEEEKVEFATARKEIGTSLFKSGRFDMALQRYKKASDMFSYIDNFKPENKEKASELKKVCFLNSAACYLKLSEHFEAKGACDKVLKEDSQNVKAVFRRAQAQLGMKNFIECMADCKKVMELDVSNREARLLLKQAQSGQKEEDKKSKGLFANMCKALGKGPIPEPFKEKRPYGDDMSDEEDVPMENAKKEETPEAAEAAAEAGA
eukprot:TRINITY_DN94015_c0_g1_i1.p1 TRINITY_DN94015_c0_g1~~TRINITY_DN94015_c0_g1_i1.p1  ORF type:complete len:582 (-),score=196.91 TRINITY_DN94015_c0_g1_i1:76-1821(-)